MQEIVQVIIVYGFLTEFHLIFLTEIANQSTLSNSLVQNYLKTRVTLTAVRS